METQPLYQEAIKFATAKLLEKEQNLHRCINDKNEN